MEHTSQFGFIRGLLENFNLGGSALNIITHLVYFAAVLILAAVSVWLFNKVILLVIKGVAAKTEAKWDDVIVERKVLEPLKYIIPIFIFRKTAGDFTESYPAVVSFIDTTLSIASTAVITSVAYRFFTSLQDMFAKGGKNEYQQMAWRSLAQLMNIIVTIITGIVIISILFNMKISAVLGYLGAAMAVLSLVFKDTIMGFITSLQVTNSRMFKVGDFVELPQYGASGTLKRIDLVTSAVQNTDNTMVTFPTYSLVSTGVKNWKSMVKSGARFFQWALPVNVMSVFPVRKEQLAACYNTPLVGEYLKTKNLEFVKGLNSQGGPAENVYIDGKLLTNLCLYRKYIRLFLERNEHISKKHEHLVRLLPGTSEGIPLEVYGYITITDFIPFENFKSSLFSHFYSMAPVFGIVLFQRSASQNLDVFVKDTLSTVDDIHARGAGESDKKELLAKTQV